MFSDISFSMTVYGSIDKYSARSWWVSLKTSNSCCNSCKMGNVNFLFEQWHMSVLPLQNCSFGKTTNQFLTTTAHRSWDSKRSNRKSMFSLKILFILWPIKNPRSILLPRSCTQHKWYVNFKRSYYQLPKYRTQWKPHIQPKTLFTITKSSN